MVSHWIIHGNSKTILPQIPSNSVHFCITSPPYFNAKEYAHWTTLSDYLADMKLIFKEVWRILQNHRVCVINVGDIFCKLSNQQYTLTRVSFSNLFVTLMTEIGFEFADDYIWDKGEIQSQRQAIGIANPYPFYIYSANCYEHILIFHKHVEDHTKLPCPVCHQTQVRSNGLSEEGLVSWECANPECSTKSEAGRGKRFSARSILMERIQSPENQIPMKFIEQWRRCIVSINPVIKINNKGENLVGHSAPFPIIIPESMIRFFTGKEEIVIDPFAGIYTTALASKRTWRNSIGIELQAEYVQVGYERLKPNETTILGDSHKYYRINIWDSTIQLPKSHWWDQDDYIKQPKK